MNGVKMNLKQIKYEIDEFGTSYIDLKSGRYLLVPEEEFSWIERELKDLSYNVRDFVCKFTDIEPESEGIGSYLDLLEKIESVRESLDHQYRHTIMEIEGERKECPKTQFSKNSLKDS